MGVEGTQIKDFHLREKGRKVKGNFIGEENLDQKGNGGGRRVRNAILLQNISYVDTYRGNTINYVDTERGNMVKYGEITIFRLLADASPNMIFSRTPNISVLPL